MDLQRIETYQRKFFANGWLLSYYKNYQQSEYLVRLFERTSLILKDEIIYTDAMDMEPCSFPFSLEKYAWNDYPEDDPEWLFMLSRQGFMVDLAQAYALTSDMSFLKKWKELFLDFNAKEGNPTQDNKNVWRPLDVGIRMMNWVKSLTYLPVSIIKELAIEDILSETLKTHLNYLENNYHDKYRLSNWGVLAMGGMAAVDLFFPEIVTEKQRQLIWQRLDEQLELQFYGDGIHWEQSPLYQNEVLMTYVYLLQISEYLACPLFIDLRKRLLKPIQAAQYLVDNQDILNPINDSDHVDFRYVYDIYRKLGLMKDRQANLNETILWVGSMYYKEKFDLVKPKSIFYGESSGLMAFKEKNIYFTLFNGLHGSSHGHATTGSFTLQLQGADIISDSGRYSYVNKKERLTLKECSAHNTMFIAEDTHTGITGSWEYSHLPKPQYHKIKELEHGFFAECCWVSESQKGLTIYERNFLYIEEINTLVILDSFSGQKDTEITSNYNLSPGVNCKKESDNNYSIAVNSEQYKILFFEGKTIQETTGSSEIYNQMVDHQRLSNKLRYETGNEVQVTVISPATDICICPINVSQVGKTGSFHKAKGFRIKTKEAIFDVFIMREDIVEGNKLLVSEFNQYFYGRVILIDNEKQIYRIK